MPQAEVRIQGPCGTDREAVTLQEKSTRTACDLSAFGREYEEVAKSVT